MNILLVTHLYPSINAKNESQSTRALHEFATYWQEQGHNVVVIRPYFFPAKPWLLKKKFEKKDNITILHSPAFGWKTLYFPFVNVKKLLDEINIQPDVVIAHMFKSFIFAHRIAGYFNSKYIIGVHNSDVINPDHSILHKLMKSTFIKYFRKADILACRSHTLKKRLLERYPELEDKCKIISSGIDKEIIEPVNICQKFETIKSGTIKFVTVARFQKLKNIDVNLKVLARINKSNWEYHLVGEGPERQRLEIMTNQLGINDKVFFHGWKSREQVLEILKTTHCFIMVSAPETFGLVYLEAMAKGNIVIGSRNWGIDGIVQDGLNGYLCTPRDEDGILEKINHILNLDTGQNIELSKNSRDTALNNTLESAGKNYLDIIKSLIEQTPAL
jgi:glycosyltransferase involved in cell wall biosynthesis